jgi:hypothetical protein
MLMCELVSYIGVKFFDTSCECFFPSIASIDDVFSNSFLFVLIDDCTDLEPVFVSAGLYAVVTKPSFKFHVLFISSDQSWRLNQLPITLYIKNR